MSIRVPLLGLGMMKSTALLYRLDTVSTAAYDPPGEPSSGYDRDFSEPVVFDAGTVRTSARRELSVVRVPCQVEIPVFERMKQYGPGIQENTKLILVTHREDLETLGLIDATTRTCLIKKSDRVSGLERYGTPGQMQQPFTPPGMYVIEVQPASWGFGTEGHDLELLFLSEREDVPDR